MPVAAQVVAEREQLPCCQISTSRAYSGRYAFAHFVGVDFRHAAVGTAPG